jgi:hypothetical protein
MRTRSVENNDVRFQLDGCKRPCVIGYPYRFDRYVGVTRDFRIDWNEVVFAFELNAIAAQINKRDSVGSGRSGFIEKIAKCASQSLLIKIAGAYDIKTSGLKRLCDQACIVGGRRKHVSLIGRVADDKRDAFFCLLRTRCRSKKQRNCRQNRGVGYVHRRLWS